MTSDAVLFLLVGFAAGVVVTYLCDKRLMERKFSEGLKTGLALHGLAEWLCNGGMGAGDAD